MQGRANHFDRITTPLPSGKTNMTIKKINIKTIRIDGGTQSRAEINNEAVSEYADAIKAGAEFPPVVVFFDGTDHWLADGFHRYHAHNQAGLASISADIRTGSNREAQLFSTGANKGHGIRRTNADKRNTAMKMIVDHDWSQWTDGEIARHCGLSQNFISSVRREFILKSDLSMEPQERKFIHPKTGTESVMKTANIGKKPVQAEPAKEPASEFEGQDFGPSEEEINTAKRIKAEQLDALTAIAESDDVVKDALEKVKQLTALNTVLNDRNNGLMNENAVLKRTVISLQRKLKEAEAANA
jgi:ParB-like nuclease domain